MLNLIRLLIIILTLLLTNAFHSEYNDSLGAHNFLGGPSSSGGARSASGGARASPAPPLATGLHVTTVTWKIKVPAWAFTVNDSGTIVS